MQYNQPYGISDPNAPYINGNPATGTAGSIPPAASIEYPQRELVNFFNDTGLTPSNSDLHQLSKAVQTGIMHYGVDTGVKNALQVNLNPAPDKYYDGMFIFVVPSISNDAASTIMVNGMAAKNIVRRGGGALGPGDLVAGYKSLLCYSALHSNFELYGINFGGTGGFLPILTANTTWYVNASTGSDTLYDGTSPTVSGPHGPFKTIAKATATVFTYGPSVYTATVQIAAGTYNEAVVTPGVVGPTTIYNGAGITQTFVSGANNQHSFNISHANTVIVTNLAVTCGTGQGPPCCFSSSGGASLYTDNTASYGAIPYSIWEAYAGYLTVGNHSFNPGNSCAYTIASFFGGFLGMAANKTLTHLGSFSCSVYCIGGFNGSVEIPVPGQTVFVNPGYVTGTKYSGVYNGIIITQGLGINYFPGNAAGAVNFGGWYN